MPDWRRGNHRGACAEKMFPRGVFKALRRTVGRTPQLDFPVPPTDSPPGPAQNGAAAFRAVRMRLGPMTRQTRKPRPPTRHTHSFTFKSAILRAFIPMLTPKSPSPESVARNSRRPRPLRRGQSVCRPAATPRAPLPGGPVPPPNPRPIPGSRAVA